MIGSFGYPIKNYSCLNKAEAKLLKLISHFSIFLSLCLFKNQVVSNVLSVHHVKWKSSVSTKAVHQPFSANNNEKYHVW